MFIWVLHKIASVFLHIRWILTTYTSFQYLLQLQYLLVSSVSYSAMTYYLSSMSFLRIETRAYIAVDKVILKFFMVAIKQMMSKDGDNNAL